MTEQESSVTKLGDGYDQPHAVSDVTLAFPGTLGDLLPPYGTIPDDFRDERDDARQWVEFQRRWFFGGIKRSALTPREGVDMDAALRHLGAIQRSFEPKHEHKMAAVAWLASRWFAAVDLSDGESR